VVKADTTSAVLWAVAGAAVLAGLVVEDKEGRGLPTPQAVSILAALAAVTYDRWYGGMWPFGESEEAPGAIPYALQNPT
jgi:hypothetical protein